MQEEHSTRIEIKVNDREASTSIKALLADLKEAQEIARNIFVGAPGGGFGAPGTPGGGVGRDGAVNGGGTTTTARGAPGIPGGGGGRGGGDGPRDARGRFVGEGTTTAGGDGPGTMGQRFLRFGRASEKVLSGAVGAFTSGPAAGIRAAQVGLQGLVQLSSSISKIGIPGSALVGAVGGAMAGSAGARFGQIGSYGQLQMQRSIINQLAGFDPGILGAVRARGTPYDAGLMKRGPHGVDPQLLGYGPRAATGILGGAARAFGHSDFVPDFARSKLMNPFLLQSQGISPASVASFVARGKVERDIELVQRGGRQPDIGGAAEQLLLWARGQGLRGPGVEQVFSRIGGMGGQIGGIGGALDVEGLLRVMNTSAGRRGGMQTLQFAQRAMGLGIGAYQGTLSGFGDMGQILSTSYAAREARDGGLSEYMRAQQNFAENPRLYAQEAKRVFGTGVGAEIAFRQAGVGNRNIKGFVGQGYGLGQTSPQVGNQAAIDATADRLIEAISERVTVAAAGARSEARTLREVVGLEADAEEKMVALVTQVTQLNLGFLALSKTLDPLTKSIGKIMGWIRR